MKKSITFLLVLIYLFTIPACTNPNTPTNTKNYPLIMTFDVYKGSSEIGVSLIYNIAQALIFIKPNGQKSLDFEATPPPPNNPNSVNKLPTPKVQEIEFEMLSLTEEAVNTIEILISDFEEEDFKTKINNLKTENGIGIKVSIAFEENNIKYFSLINASTDKQRALLNFVFDETIKLSKLNKEQLAFFYSRR